MTRGIIEQKDGQKNEAHQKKGKLESKITESSLGFKKNLENVGVAVAQHFDAYEDILKI